ncbi:urotensin 2 domain containing isoform X2 [Takifugu flavidus]|uniref:urotensin 2 domain containing isoform X2 n=1 Tax=Takifugu flavidus TaxID=433684 RepID=UPI002544CC5E|nr:urotensin 2 domain containing isoform X2 [Takifugu flavidus]
MHHVGRSATDDIRSSWFERWKPKDKYRYIEGMDRRQWAVRVALGRAQSAALVWDLPIMERLVAFDYCLGLLSLLLLQGVLNVEGRSLFSPGNDVFDPREDTDPEGKILAMLLQKSLDPVETKDPLGLELAHKLVELEQLEALREDLALERQITENLAKGKSINQKRSEPCFWKYCV